MTEVKSEPQAPSTSSSTNAPSPAPHRPDISAVIITSVVIILAVFFGIQILMNSPSSQPGTILFSDTATEVVQDFVAASLGNFSDLALDSDISIGMFTTTTSATSPSDSDTPHTSLVLYDILLPVTTFDDPAVSIAESAALDSTLVSIWDLQPSDKLLALVSSDDTSTNTSDYYLDTLDSGAFFHYIQISGASQSDVDKITNLLQSNIAAFPTPDTLLTLAQTGVTALSRRMNTRLQQIGNATYFSANIAPFLRQFDLTHTSNESSFSDQANGSNICSQPAMFDTLLDIGLDIVELTGNHNQDCGDQAAISTIEQYHQHNIQTFGGGTSSASAAEPLEISQDGANITMLGYNLSTGGYTLDDTPGANFYTPAKAQADIAAAKERGDFVIVDIQYYECNEYVNTSEDTTCDYADSSAGNQINLFRTLIDYGADIVVGTSAHQPQTFEQYHDGYIYYGLGNLFFDQSAWPGTTRSLILVHYFWQGKLIQTRIVPTVYDESFQTTLMPAADATKFLQRLLNARPVK